MKTFNQFLQDTYSNLIEEREAKRRRPGGPSPEEVLADINRKEEERNARRAARRPSGAAANSEYKFKPTTTNYSPGREKTPPLLPPAGGTSSKPALPAAGQTQRGGTLATRPTSIPSAPVGSRSNPERIFLTPVKSPTQKPTQLALPSSGQTSSPKSLVGKPPSGPKGRLGRFAGPVSTAVDTALSTADERSKGSGWTRSLAKGATVAAGGLLGGTAGAIGGGGLLSAATGTAGAMAGSAAAGKAFDVAAGANAKERAAMRQQKRLSQSGGKIVGTGGPTSISQKGKTGFISTGTGANRRTAQLGSTSVVKGPKGELQTGHLAFKTDPTTGKKQAVYKRADTSNTTLAKTSSNPFERIGRTLNPNAYKAHDAQMRSSQLKKAAASDAARQRQLGTNIVGPKIVGPKIVGPKKPS